MEISNWWPLALILFIPGIIILYMLKQKAKEYPFSSSILWKEVYHNVEATKPWEKLKKNILMYLQILALVVLIFALMAPYLRSGGRAYDKVLILVDNSASMGAMYENKHTRLQEAIDQCKDYVDSLGEATEITLLTVNQETMILKSNCSNRGEVKEALDGIVLTDLAGSAESGISVAQSMISQWEQYDLVVFTDEELELDQLQGRVVNLYTEVENVSVDYLSLSESKEGELTLIGKVTSDYDEEIKGDMNLYVDDTLVQVSEVVIPAGESSFVYFETKEQGNLYRVELTLDDAMAKDNVAYATHGENGQKRVLLVTENNIFMEKAIANISWVDLYKTNQLSTVGNQEEYDVYIFDGQVPEVLPATGNLIFINVPEGHGITYSNEVENINLLFLDSDITNYVSGYTFGALQARELERPIWADAFISTGEGCAGYFGEMDGRRIVVMSFDLQNTELPLQVEFPILMANITEYMMTTGMVADDFYFTGDKIVFNGRTEGSDIIVRAPQGEESSLFAAVNTVAYTNTDQAGVYEVSQEVNGVNMQEQFVVRFPTELESHIQHENIEIEDTKQQAQEKEGLRGGRELRNIILLIALFILGIEWWIYVKER